MTDETKIKRQKLVDKISNDNFSSSDVGQLLVYLRGDFPDSQRLTELANFITHSEGRTRGLSHDYINDFITKLIATFENSGSITIPKQLFERNSVYEELIHVLKTMDIVNEVAKFRQQKDKFIEFLLELIDEVEIKLKETKVKHCSLIKDGSIMYVCFIIESKSFLFNGVKQRVRLFD